MRKTTQKDLDIKVSRVKTEPLAIGSKRTRPTSGELSIPKRTVEAFTRGQAAKATSVPIKEEDIDSEFVSVEELLGGGQGLDTYDDKDGEHGDGEEATNEPDNEAGTEIDNVLL